MGSFLSPTNTVTAVITARDTHPLASSLFIHHPSTDSCCMGHFFLYTKRKPSVNRLSVVHLGVLTETELVMQV